MSVGQARHHLKARHPHLQVQKVRQHDRGRRGDEVGGEGGENAVEAGDRNATNTNERGETVHSLTDLNIEEGMYANAGMFAWARAIVAADMANPDGLRSWCRKQGKTPNAAITSTNMADLPQWEQFYWTTVYFNAGPGTGKKFLCSEWLPYGRTAYRGAENNLSAKYNASWRTATYRFLAGTVTPTAAAYCADKNGAACAGVSGCGWCNDQYRCTANATACGMHVTDPSMCAASAPPTAERPCGTAISCNDCVSAGSSCGWCGDTGSCVEGSGSGPASGSCSAWSFNECPNDACKQFSCTDCLGATGCGWCANTGACGAAGGSGPATGSCAVWTTDIGMCASAGDGGGSATCPPGTAVGPSGMCEPAGACQTEGGACTIYTQCCDDPGGLLAKDCVAGSCALCTTEQNFMGDSCDPAVEGSCCGTATCSPVSSPADNRCCVGGGVTCRGNEDCCGPMQCVGGACQCQTSGQPCFTGRECCGGSFCSAGRCT